MLQEASSTPLTCLTASTIPRSLRSVRWLHMGLYRFFVREACHVKGGLGFKRLSDKTLSLGTGGMSLGSTAIVHKHPTEVSLPEVPHT